MNRSEGEKWTVISKPFEKWGYTLLAAYPQSDVAAKLRAMQVIVVVCVLLVSLLVVLAQYLLVRNLVVNPLKRLTQMIHNIAEGEGDVTQRLEVAGAFGNDELGEVSRLVQSVHGQTAGASARGRFCTPIKLASASRATARSQRADHDRFRRDRGPVQFRFQTSLCMSLKICKALRRGPAK